MKEEYLSDGVKIIKEEYLSDDIKIIKEEYFSDGIPQGVLKGKQKRESWCPLPTCVILKGSWVKGDFI